MKVSILWSRQFAAGVMISGLLLLSTVGHAAWEVTIESKQITDTLQASNVTVKIDIVTGERLSAFTLPVVARTTQGFAFWMGSLPADTLDGDGVRWNNRVTWGTGVATWGNMILELRPGPKQQAGAGCNSDADTNHQNGISPDYFAVNANGVTYLSKKLTPFTFATIAFDVRKLAGGGSWPTRLVGGKFEFDTACWSGALNSIFMVDEFALDHGPTGSNEVVFTKGVVTVIGDVNSGNDPPGVVPMGPFEVNADVSDSVLFTVMGFDPEGQTPILSVWHLPPTNATFVDNGNGTGLFKFKPTPEQHGAYYIFFIATEPAGLATEINAPLADTTTVLVVVRSPALGIFEEETSTPATYSLFQNYPNPFNASTLIEFSLQEAGPVALEIYNILGQRIATPVDGVLNPGQHTIRWDGKDASGRPVSSGMYFYRLTAGKFTQVNKMVLLK